MSRRCLALLVLFGLALAFALPVVSSAANSGPNTPHHIDNWEDCTMCHAVRGVGWLARGGVGMPDDHQGKPNSSCLGCHPTTGTSMANAGIVLISTSAAVGTPTVVVTPTASVQVLAPIITSAQAATSTAMLPSAGESLRDNVPTWSLVVIGGLLLLGAVTTQFVLSRR